MEDLEFYRGLGWKGTVKTSKIVQDYIDHIRAIADEEPIILVAYIHTMYMGKIVFFFYTPTRSWGIKRSKMLVFTRNCRSEWLSNKIFLHFAGY